MTDNELLELAAKAAGIEVFQANLSGDSAQMVTAGLYTSLGHWNPLADDGDALRLAVKLCMNIEVTESYVYACSLGNFSEPAKPDRDAATRRAIVRAAAEMGRQMAD